jgi:hypothetical protein
MAVAYCEASLNYTSGMDPVPQKMTILDGREALEGLDFDQCCFTLLQHRSKVRDWSDAEQLKSIGEPETSKLAQTLSGCDFVVPYPSLIRSPAAAAQHNDYAPIHFVHTDYTDDFEGMVQDPDHTYSGFLGPLLESYGLTHADVQNASRIAMMQFWRNTGDPHPDFPLAVCDASSVSENQLGRFRVAEYAGEPLDFETFYLEASADSTTNRWYTFPGMTVDEVIAFRAFDSVYVLQHRAFWTFLSAFRDSTLGENAPSRSSVESRVLCLWR